MGIFNCNGIRLEALLNILNSDENYTGLPTNNETSETTVLILLSPFSYIHACLHLETSFFLCQNI